MQGSTTYDVRSHASGTGELRGGFCRLATVATPSKRRDTRLTGYPDLRPLQRLHRVQQLAEGLLGVAEEQGGGGLEEELVLDAGEAGAHGALHEDDLLGLVGVEDRHAVD